MYQGIAKMHSPNWFAEDKDRLEKVLLELWPNSKINPRKMYYYIDNVKGFYPDIVHEALGKIVATQEYDRRPTINQLVKSCRELINMKHKDSHVGPEENKDCDWCGYQTSSFVGLYIESPERCTALDITGKNVLILGEGWAVRPDWGRELGLTLKEYTVYCPHCAPSQSYQSALNWEKRFGPFTEFRCRQNGNTDRQWQRAYTLYQRMISRFRPETENQTHEGFKQDEAKFHAYLDSLPTLGEFTDRRMNVVRGKQPQEETIDPGPETEEGTVLPSKDEGLVQGSGIRSGDSRENPEDSNQGLEG